jgi:hypothetical protein
VISNINFLKKYVENTKGETRGENAIKELCSTVTLSLSVRHCPSTTLNTANPIFIPIVSWSKNESHIVKRPEEVEGEDRITS